MKFKKLAIYLLGALSVVLIVLVIFVKKDSAYVAKSPILKDLEPLVCDLNRQICTKEFSGKKISFEISPKPITAMQKHIIKIKGLDLNSKDLEVVFSGVNMYMGDITSSLKKNGDELDGVFVLSMCSMHSMRYKAEIFDKKKSTGIYIEFDLKQH
ncbi:hypothetical protein [Campylobacter geochelonis]|uniref:Putative periplasmic protein n=1 Tax=Campylobacter geochelonis TaxID=1780362 RepID=A0A128ECC3_9BACT|nr:hypothetical protein [Campylobacter geochelonis]QKF72156.1 hypothetical protein CGEO_1890 [Campylobacter geochelonis]CZE46615.1 putative periplasmic protein [Campylobacter geochelonis]